jgi:hypothetical protein
MASFPGIATAVANLVKASVTTLTYLFFFVEDLTGPKSQCTLLFGPRGSGNGTNGGGFVVFLFVAAWHLTHVATCLSMSASIPGHQNSPRRRCVVLNLPPCPPIQLLCASVKISFLMTAGTTMRKSFLMTCRFLNDALTYRISSMMVAGSRQCTDVPTAGSSNVDFGIAGSSLMGFRSVSVFYSTRTLNGAASTICTGAPLSLWDSEATAALTRPLSYFTSVTWMFIPWYLLRKSATMLFFSSMYLMSGWSSVI